jgi:hypothetical protein
LGNGDVSKLKIVNYNGNSKEKFRCPVAFKRFPAELNFFRLYKALYRVTVK